ncbi:MAG: glycosyltransferase [Anaerolineae bacterium]
MTDFNPLNYTTTLLTPACLHPSAWTRHVPFAMTVIDLVRPQTFVELGTHYGTSYCAFCQAVDHLKLDTRCYAVDTWTGDNHTAVYGPEVLAMLRRHHDPRYGRFSMLLQMTFDAALSRFEDGTIDLLHIDGCHTYDAAKQDFERWLPKLSERGVILFHDIHERGGDFGVWRLWEVLKARFPSFEFVHEHGLGVLAVGEHIPEALRPLLDSTPDQANVVRQFYTAAGEMVAALSRRQQTAHAAPPPSSADQPSTHSKAMLMARQYENELDGISAEFARQIDYLTQHERFAMQTVSSQPSSIAAIPYPSRLSRAAHRLIGRMRELTRTAVRLLNREGLPALVNRLYRWLILGERRFRLPVPPGMAVPDPARDYRANAFSAVDPAYQTHIRLTEPDAPALHLQVARARRWTQKPSFGVVTLLDRPAAADVQRTVESMLNQTFETWTWVLVDVDAAPDVREMLLRYTALDARIVYLPADRARTPSAALNLGLQRAVADFILRLDLGDALAPQALFAVASVIRRHPTVSLVYSDSDQLDSSGRRCDPLFKPDWSPELLLSLDYLSGLAAYRRNLLIQLGGFDESLDDGCDWDLHFRITEHSQAVQHLPEVLYHRRKRPSTNSTQPIVKHLARLGLSDPKVEFDPAHPYPLVMWKAARVRKVSIIIPSRDNAEVLRACLSSLFERTTYADFEVVVVDTGSTDPVTTQLYERYSARPNFKRVDYLADFNFGKACNLGARHSSGELLLFLNNDTEVMHADWLERMAQWYEVEGVGVVGPKLLYPDGRIQHAGVTLGWNGTAGHLFIGGDEHNFTLFGSDDWYRDMLAVSGACCMISRKVFEQIGGFDEGFVLLYSDTHLGYAAVQAGYRVVYTPHVRVIHHEAATRAQAVIPSGDLKRAAQRWRSVLLSGDPYFNPNLSYRATLPAFRDGFNSPYLLNRHFLAQIPDTERFTLPDDLL